MSISQSLIGEFEHEAATTRKCLERVPADKLTWKPHEKSMSVGDLAAHIINMTGQWADFTLNHDAFDMAPPGGPAWTPPVVTTIPAALAQFDEAVAHAKASMAKIDDATWMRPWALKHGGNDVMPPMPKVAVMRTFIMNHVYHHRGQLSLYLRLLNIPVPSIYGPSADEGQMG